MIEGIGEMEIWFWIWGVVIASNLIIFAVLSYGQPEE